jgi:hypothetical protein
VLRGRSLGLEKWLTVVSLKLVGMAMVSKEHSWGSGFGEPRNKMETK